MTNDNRILFEVLNNFTGSIDENRKSALEITDTNAEMINTIFDAKILLPEWKLIIETLIFKMIFNSYSIINLSKGYEVSYKKELKGNIIDYASIFSITRTLIENYLTLYYIYIDTKEESEMIFRYKLWESSGLISRQGYDLPNSDDNLIQKFASKKAEEKIILEKLILELEQMEEYKQLDKQKLKKLKTYGLPRIESWHTLIEKSNLRNEFFKNIYSHFSNYSHSEYISILQIKQGSYSIKNQQTLTNTRICLNITKIINSLVIEYLVASFKIVEINYNSKPNYIQKNIEMSLKLGKEPNS